MKLETIFYLPIRPIGHDPMDYSKEDYITLYKEPREDWWNRKVALIATDGGGLSDVGLVVVDRPRDDLGPSLEEEK